MELRWLISLFLSVLVCAGCNESTKGMAQVAKCRYGTYPSAGRCVDEPRSIEASGFAKLMQSNFAAFDGWRAVAVTPSGKVLVGGYAVGPIPIVASSSSGQNGLVQMFSADGVAEWTREFGSGLWDEVSALAVDGLGNTYVAGYTFGALKDSSHSGGMDIFVARLGTTGAVEWLQQIGTTSDEQALALAVCGNGDIYVAGRTTGMLHGASLGGADAVVSKLSSADGSVVWNAQFGTESNDEARAIGCTSDNIPVVAGVTEHKNPANEYTGGSDIFVTRLTVAGEISVADWIQFGSKQNDDLLALQAAVQGKLWIAGGFGGAVADTVGNKSLGAGDAFVARLDIASWRLELTQVFGTSANDMARALAFTNSGRLFVAGETSGSFAGANSHVQGADLFLAELSPETGIPLRSKQVGTVRNDYLFGLGADSAGFLYAVGATEGNMLQVNRGGRDGFVLTIEQSLP